MRDASGSGKEYWSLLNEPENIYAGQVFNYDAKQSYNILQYCTRESRKFRVKIIIWSDLLPHT